MFARCPTTPARASSSGAVVLLSGFAWPRREARALVAALLATGYGFTTVVLIQAITGERVFSVSRSPILLLAFVANLVPVLGAFLSTGLILIGARAALKQRKGA